MPLLQNSPLETKLHPGARESRSHANRNLDDKFRSLKSAPADNDVKLESNNDDNEEQSKDEPLPGITLLTSQRDVNAFFHHRMNGLADGVKDIKSSLKDLFPIIEGYLSQEIIQQNSVSHWKAAHNPIQQLSKR